MIDQEARAIDQRIEQLIRDIEQTLGEFNALPITTPLSVARDNLPKRVDLLRSCAHGGEDAQS